MSLVRFRFWAFINFKYQFLFHYSHYGTIWPCFKFYVQPIPDFGANITSPCFYTPVPFSNMWLFQHFLASIPPRRSWPRGFFSPFSLLSPVPNIGAWLFSPFSVSMSHLHRKCSLYMDMFCHHAQKNSLIRVCLFDKFFTVS